MRAIRCMKASIFSKLAAIVLIFASISSNAKPLVLSSLQPLTLIAQEITGTAANVDTLLPLTASHHDYPLKTSDHTRLKQADVILWVGPELESFLQKPLGNLEANKIITAYALAGIYWPKSHNVGAHKDSHDHAQDPHLWLDPRNAIVVARALTEKLANIDSINSTYYRENFRLFDEKVQKLDEKLKASMKPLAGIGFVVYHEGFGHFVSHYDLKQLDYVTYTPEQKPGARHLHQLRLILANEAKCIFLEPYGDTQSARDLAQEFKLRTAVVDALGSQNVSNYSQLLERMSDAFLTCLTN
ncbi:MAG: zinc ABC transporter substrate-binding protein [Gammaproteobacteria bacterium]|nr:MAG: zinc ABC transporter substrate-binding protein [Gammaproteobacteria bacterium]